jgi:magnesium-transporting ATPase (P-type)
VATGDSTVFGRIAKLAGEPKKGLTTIEKEVFRFVLLIFIIMVTWIVILAAVWYVKHPNRFFISGSLETNSHYLSGAGGYTRRTQITSMFLH